MKCPECQFDNREGAIFCSDCGLEFRSVCTNCGSEIQPDSNFCDKCGHQLSKKESINKKKPSVGNERKNVTVLFSDMSAYTAMTERLDPEEVKDIMSRIFGEIAQVITKYEGFIERFIGDAVMAIFGVPKVHEDDPVRAIKAAREIHAVVEGISPRLKDKVGQQLTMHTGINTGIVVTGQVDIQKGTHGITGDTVNLASRLEGIAGRGEILVGEQTFRNADGYFIFERTEPKIIKGKEGAIHAYRVIAPSTRRTRFDVDSVHGLTPLVGRETELNILIEGFYRSKEGSGQAFSIISEAGLGKSRLLYEFRKSLSKEKVQFLEGKCLSYSKGVAYHPIIDILRSNFDIRNDDRDDQIIEKVKAGIEVLSLDKDSTLPYFLELLSVKDSGIDDILINSEGKKERIIEALKMIVVKGAELKQLIIAIEDLHWIDKSSEEVFKYVLESIPGSRIMLLFTYRPEFINTWGVKSYHSQITLNRLSNRESLTMVSQILNTGDIGADLEELILKKTEGVPFFIEEYIKSFKDLQIIERKGNTYRLTEFPQSFTIPSTIQDVLMARVDSLPENAKVVLQAGSVIGREFGYMLIKEVTRLPEQAILSCLSILKDAEFIYERGIYPQSAFIFRHALTRDTVYQSLLKSTRKKYHETIARVFEELYPKVVELQPELLGFHLTEAGLVAPAITYWLKAGEIEIRRSANIEAIGHLKRGLELFKTLPSPLSSEHNKLELSLQIALGNAVTAIKGYADPEVGNIFSCARDLCLQEDESPQLFQVLHGLARYHIVRAELQTTQELGEQLLRLAKRSQDPVLLLTAHQLLGTALWFMGKFSLAQEQFELGIPYYDSNQHSFYIRIADEDQGVICYSYMAWTSWLIGYPDRALELIRKALILARKLSHPFSLVFALNYAAITYQCCQDDHEVKKHAEEAITLATQQGFTFWAAFAEMFLGWAMESQGQREEGITLIRNSFNAWQATGAKLAGSYFRALMAEAYLKTKNIESGLNAVADALTVVDTSEECIWEAELYRIKGELLLMNGEPEVKVESCFKQGMEIAKRQRAKSLELRSTLSLSRLYKKQGKSEIARRILTEIYDWFTEGYNTQNLRDAKSLLHELS